MYNFDLEKMKADINTLYDEYLDSTTPFHRRLDLFIVPENIVQRVLVATGVDISNHWVCIDNFGIEHALEHHGNPASEAKRGQIAIRKDDFAKFLDVFLEPDDISLVGTGRHTKLPMLQFVKVIDDKKIVIKEVRTTTSLKRNKQSRIMFHTMYKKK